MADETTPPSADEIASLRREIAELRKEAADRRVTARTAQDERERATADLSAAQRRLAELEPYEGTVRTQVAELKARLGTKAEAAEGLTDLQALKVLRQLEALAAGPGAARTTTSGAPAPVHAGSPDIQKMAPKEIRAHMARLKPDEVRELARQHGNVRVAKRPFN